MPADDNLLFSLVKQDNKEPVSIPLKKILNESPQTTVLLTGYQHKPSGRDGRDLFSIYGLPNFTGEIQDYYITCHY
jgi:hypothetical protein